MVNKQYSILMSVYYKENPQYFDVAIKSMLQQTIRTNDFVVVCDGELTDELNNVIYKYKREFPEIFNIIKLPQNRGLGEALRKGLTECKNEFVARMDSDDVSMPDRIEKQMDALQSNNEVSVIGGQISEFDDNENNIIGYRVVPQSYEEIKKCARKKNPMNHMTVMFRKSHVLGAGNYEHMDRYEDYFLWIRMILNNMQLENIPDVLVNVRAGKEMYKRRGGWDYFLSGYRFQKYLLKSKIIKIDTFFINLMKRAIVQVLLPNGVREYLYKKVARQNYL